MEEEKVDQHVLAEDLASKIKYDFLDYILVKPLDPIKVSKEFSEPVTSEGPTKDQNGVEATDFEDVKTEVKEVDSDFRKGIVLKIPMNTYVKEGDTFPISVGDVILFRERSAGYFDLLKDSRLVRYYDVIAIER